MIYSPVRKGITLAKQTRKSFNNSVGTAEVEVISLVIDSYAVTSIYGRKNAVTTLLTNAINRESSSQTALY